MPDACQAVACDNVSLRLLGTVVTAMMANLEFREAIRETGGGCLKITNRRVRT